MKIATLRLRLGFAMLAASAAFCASAVADINIWTDGFGAMAGGGPYWVNSKGAEANWSLGTVPVATDDVVFQLPFVPPNSTFNTGTPPFQPLANGQTVVLFPSNTNPPALVANSLTFSGNYTLVTAAATFNQFGFGPYDVEPLTLTSGRIAVTGGVTATIDVPLVSLTGTLVKTGPGLLRLNDVFGTFPTILGNLNVQQGAIGGNFTVTGNFQQSKGTAVVTTLSSATVFDQIRVRGSAQLTGELDVALLNGFLPKKGEKFTIVTAGSRSGEFDTVNAPVWGLLTLRPFYTGNAVTLQTVVNSFGLMPGMTGNQRNTGVNVDAAMNDPRAAKLMTYLYGQSLSELPRDLDRIAPEELTSAFAIGIASEKVQALNLQRRGDDIRSGSSGFSAANLAINGSGPSYSGGFGITTGVAGPSGNDGKESKEVKTVAPTENRWGAFLSGTGEWVNVSGTDNARGYNLDSGGFTLGIDYKVCPNCAIGLMAGYTGTSADLTDHGRVFVNGGKLGIYATTFVGGWYADIAATGGYNSYDTRRSALQGEARGDTDGGELDALFGTGYDFKLGGLTFGPTASFNYTNVGTNGYTEHGSLVPLNIHGGTAESLRTAFGLKASYDYKLAGLVLRPEIRAAWQHEYGDSAYALDSSFANGAGNSFLVNGPKLGRDSALIGAGFAIQVNERLSTYFYYDGELGRTNYESNSVTGGVRLAF